eukprot:295585-Pyramimonas_sp.AAC.1
MMILAMRMAVAVVAVVGPVRHHRRRCRPSGDVVTRVHRAAYRGVSRRIAAHRAATRRDALRCAAMRRDSPRFAVMM